MSFPYSVDFRDDLARICSAFPRRAYDGPELTRAAVAITLVGDEDGQTAFLLTRRAAGLRAHGGQWALPGGRCDPGETIEQAALRELEEELGLALEPRCVLGVLDDYATRSGYAVSPVLVWADGRAMVTPNPAEVDSVHRIGLEVILRPEAASFETIPESDRPVIRLNIGEHDIHAPTAALIYQFRELLDGRVTRVLDLEQPKFAWA